MCLSYLSLSFSATLLRSSENETKMGWGNDVSFLEPELIGECDLLREIFF